MDAKVQQLHDGIEAIIEEACKGYAERVRESRRALFSQLQPFTEPATQKILNLIEHFLSKHKAHHDASR